MAQVRTRWASELLQRYFGTFSNVPRVQAMKKNPRDLDLAIQHLFQATDLLIRATRQDRRFPRLMDILSDAATRTAFDSDYFGRTGDMTSARLHAVIDAVWGV